jgi:carboxyl-terminal processing protease
MKKMKTAAFVVLATVLFSGFFPSDTDIYFRIAKSIETFGKVYKEVSINYVEKINPEEFMLSGIKGMLSQLDPYTVYIDSKDQRDLDIMTSGKYGGIGITVSFDESKATVVDLVEGYSAQKQGIRIGDVIKKVNDVDIDPSNNDYMNLIQKGDPGTSVTLTIQREGSDELLKFVLVREEIEIKNVTYCAFVPENSNNAYIKLSGFTRTAGEEVKNAINELNKAKTINSIILDLRDNPGGLLEAAVDVCEKFLKKGVKVVSVIGRDSTGKKDYYSQEEPLAGNLPLAVLVDNGSASASEIVAGAIQDHDRGLIVGETTYGKGLVQGIIPLSGSSSLKITTARYYTPSGRCIQKINYSDKNKVFELQGKNKINQFFTDRKRKVFSAGGIVPDSTVKDRRLSPFFYQLLGEGMFFKFATHYFNQNPGLNIKSLDGNKLFAGFAGFMKSQKFSHTPRSIRMAEQLKKALTDDKYDGKAGTELDHLIAELEKSKDSELERFKDEIIPELKDELAERIAGRKGMIKETLKEDPQFKTALSLISNNKVYNKLLNGN